MMKSFTPPHDVLTALSRSEQLPDDVESLLGAHTLAGDRLESFAAQVETSWAEAESQYRETVALLELQAAIIDKLAALPAWGPTEVLRKLRLWRDTGAIQHGSGSCAHERNLLSAILGDFERICAGRRSADA